MRQDITISDGTIVHTLDAFPFDSSPNLVTTEQGYRRGDRAVDAWTMQRTFAQFFSDGVFGTPADAFQIAKASSGLAVTIQPGMAIIQGGMGGIKDSDGPLVVTLDTAAAAGNVCYGIMLRYDNNSDVRSLGIRAVKGVAGSNPQPPAPDTSSAGVKELRLGYVTVPNGATDLSNATVTNEKGLDACPYAAPFEEIDLSSVTNDARVSANEALDTFYEYIEQNKGLLDSALDDTTAGYLQQQITALQESLANIDLSGTVDGVTIEYAKEPGEPEPKMRVKDSGITTGKMADFNVTAIKLSADLQVKLDVVDTDGWTFDQYEEFIIALPESSRGSFIDSMDGGVVAGWTADQLEQICSELGDSDAKKILSKCSIESYTWQQVRDLASSVNATVRSGLIGKTKSTTINGSSIAMIIIGVGHDNLSAGGKSTLSLMTNGGVGSTTWFAGQASDSVNYSNAKIRTYCESTLYDSIDSGLKSLLKNVSLKYKTGGSSAVSTMDAKVFPLSSMEVFGTGPDSAQEGSRYEYFASGNWPTLTASGSWLRSVSYGYSSSSTDVYGYYVDTSHTSKRVDGGKYTKSVLLGMCI